jgi:enoyl-CoA hydratase/carnithine racemase
MTDASSIGSPDIRWADPEALARGELEPCVSEFDSTAPVVFVSLDDPWTPEVHRGAAAALARSGYVAVGVSNVAPSSEALRLAYHLDLTLCRSVRTTSAAVVTGADLDASLEAISASVRANPRASLVLAELLRRTNDAPIMTALALESFAYSALLAGPEFQRWLGTNEHSPPAPAPSEPVRVERHDDTLHITLNRPDRRNAYGRELRDALVEAMRFAQLDDSIAAVRIDGAGPVFCSGGDLGEFGTTPDPVTAHLVRTRAGAAPLFAALTPKLTVRMHGTCVGAGVELAAFAERVEAAADTTFRLPEVSMGLVPGAGGTVSLPRRIGRWRTAFLALTGGTINAATALQWGLVDQVT